MIWKRDFKEGDSMTQLQLMEDMDFEVRQEVWNIYELEDGSTIRFKGVLVRVLRDPKIPEHHSLDIPQNMQQFQLRFQNIVIVKSPISLKRESSGPISPQDIEVANKLDVRFNPFCEGWNIYVLKDGVEFRVRHNVSVIEKVEGQFDEMGNPVYRVNSVPAITAFPPKKKK